MTDRLETHVLSVNSVMTVQQEVLTLVLNGLHQVQENHSQVAMLVPAVTLLVQVQIQEHLVESGLLKDQLVMIVHQDVNGHQSVLHAMTVHQDASGLQKDHSVMTELLVESGLQKDQLVMIVHQDVNGHQSVLLAMIVHLAESGLLKDLLVMIVLLVVSGVILVHRVMTEVQEILVDQIAWKEMTTVSVHSMEQETSLLTRRLSLKMLF
jgi:hypothetical protein